MNICYFDAFAGISGDMTVGALIDAGADPAALTAGLESLGTGASYRVERTKRKGIAAAKFHVDFTDSKKHRHLPHILDMIGGSSMPDRAKQRASDVFRKLGEAEATVHGVPMEKVHFHEVGAIDSISDICGAAIALELLGVDECACSAVNVGSGTVNTQHGVLPVPTPATSLLLRDRPVYARGPAMELTTPTGAAIAATLATRFGPVPAMRIASTGYGAGDRDFSEHANVLRVLIGQASRAAEATVVSVIEANIDDSTPEILGYAMERLFDSGALDVTIEPLLMKKNRPGSLLRVIAPPDLREPLAGLVLAETSTLGVRIYEAERRVQEREIREAVTPWGPVRIKRAANGTFAPEYEDCCKLALATGVPLKQIFAEASHQFLKNS
ncbi:MAG: nickel pincer cofactor biosynthesis protein LarC [Acidobacteria bacterium]|nr:nickel pincer cofactor biosynthesis protein LarC [Acidobacteriota bacterium]